MILSYRVDDAKISVVEIDVRMDEVDLMTVRRYIGDRLMCMQTRASVKADDNNDYNHHSNFNDKERKVLCKETKVTNNKNKKSKIELATKKQGKQTESKIEPITKKENKHSRARWSMMEELISSFETHFDPQGENAFRSKSAPKNAITPKKTKDNDSDDNNGNVRNKRTTDNATSDHHRNPQRLRRRPSSDIYY